MPSWLILFAIIVVCLTVLLFIKHDTTEGFGQFKNEQMAFANKQYTYFHDTAGKGILTNHGLKLNGVNDALAQPDLYLAKSPGRDYTSYFAEDPELTYSKKDEAFCKNAISPRDMPKRIKGADLGCGWYYVDNAAVPSTGVLGTTKGPIFTKGLPANGEWIWNISKAIMKEEIKACKRVKSCDLMSVEGIHGKCGFCERLGYAVPINTDGTEKYPDAEIGSCGKVTVKDAAGCYKPTPQPLVTSDGIECGTYGYPSPDNSMRMYLKSECDTLNGTLSPNGECVNKAGVSYSWSCRGLNRPIRQQEVVQEEDADKDAEEEEEDDDEDEEGKKERSGSKNVVAVVKTICSPNANGGLSRECLQSLATGLGYSKTGAMMRLLSGDVAPGETDRLVIDELKKNGYAVPSAILGSGDIDMLSAATLYQKIYEAMARGKTALTRQAAKWLVTGIDTFDICEFDSDSTGPFPTVCLQRAFRMSGCQASGNKYPDDKNALDYANRTWGAINSMFYKLYSTMKSGKASEQDAAVKDCLGFAYARPPPVVCEKKPAPVPVVVTPTVVPTVALDPSDLIIGPMTYNGQVSSFKPKNVGGELHLLRLGVRAASAFLTIKRPVTNFYTSFTARFANNWTDGMTFCIQNQGPDALGGGGGPLGFLGIYPGVAIRLDNQYTHNNYDTNYKFGSLSVGYLPTGVNIKTGYGFTDLAESGDITKSLGLQVNGDWLLNVEIKYSNNNLSIIITNAKNTALKYSRTIPNVDLPKLVGGNNAWFGFTAGERGEKYWSSDIFISNWKLSHDAIVPAPVVVSPVPPPVVVTPTVAPVPQPVVVAPTVAPASSDLLMDPMTLNAGQYNTSSYYYNSSLYYAKPRMVGGQLNMFPPASLGLPSNRNFYNNRAVSAFLTVKRPVTNFYTSFTAHIGSRMAGMTFCIQNSSPQAVGAMGGSSGNLGYYGIQSSVAIPLGSMYNTSSFVTGLLMGGGATLAGNSANSVDIVKSLGLQSTGFWLLNVEIKYSNNSLSIVITNANNTALKYSRTIPNVDLPRLVGGTSAWFGFTAGRTSYNYNYTYNQPGNDMIISNWKMTHDSVVPAPVVATPVPQPVAASPVPRPVMDYWVENINGVWRHVKRDSNGTKLIATQTGSGIVYRWDKF